MRLVNTVALKRVRCLKLNVSLQLSAVEMLYQRCTCGYALGR